MIQIAKQSIKKKQACKQHQIVAKNSIIRNLIFNEGVYVVPTNHIPKPHNPCPQTPCKKLIEHNKIIMVNKICYGYLHVKSAAVCPRSS